MKLKTYVKKTGLSIRGFAQRLNGPSHQAVAHYINGIDSPGLEVALMISAVTKGEVLPHELICDDKRKYTVDGDPIFSEGEAETEEEIIL